MTVPILSVNIVLLLPVLQSRQRCVIVLCAMSDWTLKLPHFGQ